MMQIANPIYDSVFKYLLNDNKVAKLLLSAIIGDEIIELDFQPTEIPLPINESILVLRMDFKATVKYRDGSIQVIIIELQKAKLHTDIMRFRRYLGQQYQDTANSEVTRTFTTKDGDVVEYKKAFPILSIYFLGHKLDYGKPIPVIKVARQYVDIATGETLEGKEEFIESLTHDSFIIQIPYLKGNRRTELEQLLHIFDQSQLKEKRAISQILEIDDNTIPARYQPVLRRLIQAFANKKVRNLMNAEDELISELRGYARIVQSMKEELQEKDDVFQNALQEKDNAIQEKNDALQEKDNAITKGILEMLNMNIPEEKIAQIFNVTLQDIQNIKNSKL
jgi:hypothetical protein